MYPGMWGNRLRSISILLVLISVCGTSAADSLVVTRTTNPPSRVTIELDERFAPAAGHYFSSTSIAFADLVSGPVEVYPLAASPAERIEQACKLLATGSAVALPTGPTSPACDKLFEKLGAERLELAISKPGSTAYAVIELKPLRTLQGGDAGIDVPLADDGVPGWDTVAIPKHVRVKNTTCYLMLDQPRPITCDQTTEKVTVDADSQAVVQARWARKDKVWLVAYVLDAETSPGKWRKLALRAKPPKPPDETDDPAGLADLEGRCKESISYPARGDTYYVCVDLRRKAQGILTLRCGKDANSCEFVGDVVQVRRNFVVRVWRDDDVIERVTFGGTPGSASLVRDGMAAAGGGAGAAETKVQVWNFGPRKPGTAQLVVTALKLKDDAPSAEIAKLEFTYTIEAYYRMAIRLGLGFAWKPWARNVGILSSADGQRYSAILEGEDVGLTQTELVTGFTYLCSDVRQDSLDVAFGLGVRLGLVGIGSSFTSFTSLTAGPELAIGPDFSVGIYAGVARHEAPNGGYQPGMLVPTAVDKIPTHVTATPTFGLVLNFTPGFLKSVGVVK